MPILRSLFAVIVMSFSLQVAAQQTAVTGVDHVGLVVKDIEASKSVFVDVLGFSERGSDPSYPAYFLSNGKTTITLWRASHPEKATPFNRKTNVGLHHLALGISSEAELNRLYKALKDFPGVNIEFAPELAYGGPSKHMMFYEPSGNRIELVHRPQK
ncbi:VOC family protein [Pseudoteredinibacter isoporae]|uniref:VOC family protein n=1 Tax=Pseudoteredinibacter isoporae TaxID=570281 RepID=UPI003104BBA7